MTIQDKLSHEEIISIAKSIDVQKLSQCAIGTAPLIGYEYVQKWSKSSDPQTNLQTLLNVMKSVEKWQKDGMEHEVNIHSLSTLNKVDSELVLTNNKIPTLELTCGKLPVECLAAQVLRTPLFSGNQNDPISDCLNKKITSTAKRILKKTLPISIELGEGLIVKEELKPLFLGSMRLKGYW